MNSKGILSSMASSNDTYRNAMQVLPADIKNLSDTGFNFLMLELLRAQAYRCGVPSSGIIVNNEEKAKDGGSDGMSAAPKTTDPWLGSDKTCWQFKAGTAGQRGKIKGEITKPIPMKTLLAGGRFVLVTNGSNNGVDGETSRLEALQNTAKENGLPIDKIHVMGSERIAEWCNLHPAIATQYGGRPTGLWTLDEWAQSEDHQVPWQGSDELDAKILALQKDINFDTGSIQHLHIQGLPGVGKSRFALELCRTAEWKSAVIYFRQAADTRLNELIDSVSHEADIRLVVVADEVQYQQLLPLRDSIGRSDGRIKLISIGHSHSPDPSKIVSTFLAPLDANQMATIIKGWHQSMPIENIDFTVRFSGGFVKLAHLASDAVAANPAVDVQGLLDLEYIRGFLDSMLGDGDRRSLFVVAALTKVGWSNDLQGEGESIANHLGLDWGKVKTDIESFHQKYGIVPRGGRYRYISPSPLGNYLALDAWKIYPEEMKSLPSTLPSEVSIESYNLRLRQIAGNPEAKEFAHDELGFFFQKNKITRFADVSRWSALSVADPNFATLNLIQTLEKLSIAERLQIKDSVRRELIWALVKMSRSSTTFFNSTRSLVLLAEAENETYANNSTAEFLSKYQIRNGDTSVPYLDRLSLLDELIEERSESLNSLVFQALLKWDETSGFRSISDSAIWEPEEPEWKPANTEDYIECVDAAIERLKVLIDSGIPGIEMHYENIPTKFIRYVRFPLVREAIAALLRTLGKNYPTSREAIQKSIGLILYSEKKRPSDLKREDLLFIEELHSEFEDNSLSGRLHQLLSIDAWEESDTIDYKSLAAELLEDKSILVQEFPWLTSGQGGGAWAFGLALAESDIDNSLQDVLPTIPGQGNDLRLTCAYVSKKREALGDEWFDIWFSTQFKRAEPDIGLIIEITYRCGITIKGLDQLTDLFKNHTIDRMIAGQLAYGKWSDSLPQEELKNLLEAMVSHGHEPVAIALLATRLREGGDAKEFWKTPALSLITNPELIRGQSMTEHYWSKVSLKYVESEAALITKSICAEQAAKTDDIWFIRHSSAAKVLMECFEIDPVGSWKEVLIYLDDKKLGLSFRIGFPRGVVDKVPWDNVHNWIKVDAINRARILAHYVNKDVSKDSTYASRIIGEFSNDNNVAGAFRSAFSSGSYSGSSARRFEQIAESLKLTAQRTKLKTLKKWANSSVEMFLEQSKREQLREDEDYLR